MTLEVCIHSKDDDYVVNSVFEAYQGGAERIELCSHMEQDGLTPCVRHVELARVAFKDRSGLLVMIRPVGGDFFYNPDEIGLMERQIVDAAKAGADGVVIGVLDKDTSSIHQNYCRRLVERAREYELSVTFHRAFDATIDWRYSLETLMALGVDRVLSSGTAWASPGTALDGVDQLVNMGKLVSGDLEIVVGGGVSMANAGRIICALKPEVTRFSLHTYSAVLENGNVSSEKIQQLKKLEVKDAGC